MNIRLVMIAFLAIVCNTSKAQVQDSPLNPWYDSSVNSNGGYVLRTIDDEHTVLNAMQALQDINGTDWSSYYSYPFYLIEDVDLSQLDGNWVPLGTTDYPFYGNFYCYKPTYSWYSGPGIQASIADLYPKVEDIENKPKLQWEGAYKYTFSVSDIESVLGKTKYTFSVSDIMQYITDNGESYSDINKFISSEIEGNYIYKLNESDETLIVVTDDKSSINILSEVSSTGEDYIENLDNYDNDFNTFISSILEYYFVEYDESAGTLSFSTTEDDLASLTIFSCLTPTTDPEQAYYKLLPFTSNLGSLGYYYDESVNQIYYSTDGHIGTCKIKNMTVEGEYDAAGFFGVVEGGTNVSLYGFTFESCSVRNTKEDGYAGILYGVCNNDTECPYIYDIFIGQSESNLCSVTADYVGGVYGYNVYESNQIYSTNSISSSEKTFDPELSPYNPETHEGAYYADDYEGSDGEAGYSVNKIYVNITANKLGNKVNYIDSEARHTYAYAAGIAEKFAFGTENGEYGDGTQSKPFIISDKDHLLHLQSILNGINGDSYKSYEDLKNLDLSTSSAGSIFDGCYFKQIEDIDFGDEPLTAGIGIDDSEDSDTEAGPFAGTYDGGGHTIKVNIHIDEENTSDPAALFANTYEATIKNLSIKGTNTNDSQYGYAAGIVGNELNDYLTLQNCLIDVTIEAEYYPYALIGYCESTSNLFIQDCLNKGAKDLEWFYGANSYFIEDSNKDNIYFTWPGTYGGPGAGVPDSPLQISSLAVFNTEKGKKWAEYGLAYELTDNIVLQNTKLVDPDGDYIGPDSPSNKDYYIEKFCGTLIGGHYDETSSTCQTHIIAGLTDKALFGTITGDSKIEKIGFVNCYNANGDHSVKLAGNIESEKTLTVQECYSDGYMDLGYDTENEESKEGYDVIDCYSYSDIANTPVKTFQKKDDAGWESDGVNPDREILSSNCIETNCDNTPIYSYKVNIFKKEYGSVSYDETDLYALGSYSSTDGSNYFTDITKTDAISAIPQNNMVWNTDDPRLQFKYNVNYNGEVKYMYLTDIAAVGTNTDMSDAVINSMNFDTSKSYNIKNIYYRRPHHNAWESVTLPFAYNLNSINEKFTAFDFEENTSTDATFISINKNTTVAAGSPLLFFNEDSDNTDFVAKASKPVTIATAGTGNGTFYGVLQSTGIRGAAVNFDSDCYNQYQNDYESSHYDMYVYKIGGGNTGTNEEPAGELLKCTETSWIYPFRTYLKSKDFTADNTDPNTGAKSIRFMISWQNDDDSATSIKTPIIATEVPAGNVYSLDGRKVSSNGLTGLKAGLYIVNGKKYVVK